MTYLVTATGDFPSECIMQMHVLLCSHPVLLVQQEFDTSRQFFSGFGCFLPSVQVFLQQSSSLPVVSEEMFRQGSLALQHETVAFPFLANSLKMVSQTNYLYDNLN